METTIWTCCYDFSRFLVRSSCHVNRAPSCSSDRLLQQPRRNQNGISGQEGFRDSAPRMD